MKKEKIIEKIEEGLKQTIFSDLQETALPLLWEVETYNECLSCYLPIQSIYNEDFFKLISEFISEEVMNRVSCYTNSIYTEKRESVRCVYARLNNYTIEVNTKRNCINVAVRYKLDLETEIRK